MTHKKARRLVGVERRSMLPVLLLGGALVLAVLAIGLAVMSADAGNGGGGSGPQLAVNQDRIDFGNLPFDKTVRAEFKLENKGDRNLTLDVSTPIRVVEGC